MKINSIAALLLIGTTVMMAETNSGIDGIVPEGTEGDTNTYYGVDAGNVGGGDYNSFFGRNSGKINTGNANTFIGYDSGFFNTEGYNNTFIGTFSGVSNTTGVVNTFIGYGSGYNNTDGWGNVFLGYRAGYDETGSNKLYIDNSSTTTPLIYGEFDNDLVRVNGKLEGIWVGSNTEGDGLTNLLVLSAENTEVDKSSDAGFRLVNGSTSKGWNFRTNSGGDSFQATLAGTGGAEFTVTNTTSNVSGTELYLGNGAKNVGGVWINASSRVLKENIKALNTEDALKAFHNLQPVTYNYKSDKSEKVVGFIAEDVPELVAIKSRDGLSAMDMVAVLTKVVQEQEKNNEVLQQRVENQEKKLQAKDAEMKARDQKIVTMQKRLIKVESLLTNLALGTSNANKEKVSMK